MRTAEPLSDTEVDRFVADGFVPLRGAFAPSIARIGCERLWSVVRRQLPGFDPEDPTTWPGPFVSVPGSGAAPFRRALTSGRLTAAFDQLVGVGRWLPHAGLGPFPIRLPHPGESPPLVWHVDASYVRGEGDWRLDVGSRRRALLLLMLFTDVGVHDAPTLLRVGSHLDVPPVLVERGRDGMHFAEVVPRLPELDRRPIALATGRAGDVYLCHPFLVHTPDRNRGSRPRVVATPVLEARSRLRIARSSRDVSPVELAVKISLGRARPAEQVLDAFAGPAPRP